MATLFEDENYLSPLYVPPPPLPLPQMPDNGLPLRGRMLREAGRALAMDENGNRRLLADNARARMKYTPLEVRALVAGVHYFNEGQWDMIVRSYHLVFDPQGRTSDDLRSKWANLQRSFRQYGFIPGLNVAEMATIRASLVQPVFVPGRQRR